MSKLMLATMLAVTLTLTLGSAAVAASPNGNGATVINVDDCAPLIGGGTVCFASKGVVNEVVTPSGNTSYVANVREELRVIENGQVTWEETSTEHYHDLTVDGELQELSWRARFTVTSSGEPFCVQYHIHGANGADQFVRIDFC